MKLKNIIFIFFLITIFQPFLSLADEFYVSIRGNDENDGTKNNPFRTIQAAANVAYPGDVITVLVEFTEKELILHEVERKIIR